MATNDGEEKHSVLLVFLIIFGRRVAHLNTVPVAYTEFISRTCTMMSRLSKHRIQHLQTGQALTLLREKETALTTIAPMLP